MNATRPMATARLRLLVALDATFRDAAVLDEVTRLAASAPLEVTLLRVAHYHTRGGRAGRRVGALAGDRRAGSRAPAAAWRLEGRFIERQNRCPLLRLGVPLLADAAECGHGGFPRLVHCL